MSSGQTSRLVALCFDANDPLRLARFWAAALGWEMDDQTPEEIGLVPTDGTRFRIDFRARSGAEGGGRTVSISI